MIKTLKNQKQKHTFESSKEIKCTQEYASDQPLVVVSDDLNEEKIDPRIQPMFKLSRHNNIHIFKIGKNYYEIPKGTIRANGNTYHIFEPKKFRDVQSLYQDKTSMDMTLNEIKKLTSTCCSEKYQPLSTDITKDEYTDRYRLGLNSLFLPNTSAF